VRLFHYLRRDLIQHIDRHVFLREVSLDIATALGEISTSPIHWSLRDDIYSVFGKWFDGWSRKW
jgi:hypothetical protein